MFWRPRVTPLGLQQHSQTPKPFPSHRPPNPSTSFPCAHQSEAPPVGVSRSPRFKSELVTSPHRGSRPRPASVAAASVQRSGNLNPPTPASHLIRLPHSVAISGSTQMCRRPRAEGPSPQVRSPRLGMEIKEGARSEQRLNFFFQRRALEASKEKISFIYNV